MIRTVISEADLEDKTREIVDRVRHGEMAVLEDSGEEQIVLLDATDFRLLQALAACATEASDLREVIEVRILRDYLDDAISLGQAAEGLGLSQAELEKRFHRLGILLPSGLESLELEDAQREIPAARKLRRESFQHLDDQALLESFNRAYEDGPTPEEKLVRQLMKQKQREMVKGEW